MALNAPTTIVFWISVALAVLGLLGNIGVVAAFVGYSFWFVAAGFVLLAAGNILKGF